MAMGHSRTDEDAFRGSKRPDSRLHTLDPGIQITRERWLKSQKSAVSPEKVRPGFLSLYQPHSPRLSPTPDSLLKWAQFRCLSKADLCDGKPSTGHSLFSTRGYSLDLCSLPSRHTARKAAELLGGSENGFKSPLRQRLMRQTDRYAPIRNGHSFSIYLQELDLIRMRREFVRHRTRPLMAPEQ